MKQYSVECAQPYNDSESDRIATLTTLRGLLSRIHYEGADASVVSLVDDTTHENKDYDFDSYARWLGENGFGPDLVARESDIKAACDTVLGSLDFSKLPPEIAEKLQSEQKYTSQLFIATWCLLRLGYIENENFDPSLQAEKLVNVLPLSFKEGEEESLNIIKATPFAEAADHVEYVFVPQNDQPSPVNLGMIRS